MGEIQRYDGPATIAQFAGKEGVAKALARLSATMKSRNFAEPALAKLAVTEADRVLREISATALDRAVSRFIAGQCGDGSGFAPTVAELAAEARWIEADEVRATRMRATFAKPKQLAAPDQTPEERARRAQIATQARKMAHGWKSNRAPETPARYVAPQDELGMTRDEAAKATAEWHLERAKALGALPAPKLSAEAVKTIGLQPRLADDAA